MFTTILVILVILIIFLLISIYNVCRKIIKNLTKEKNSIDKVGKGLNEYVKKLNETTNV